MLTSTLNVALNYALTFTRILRVFYMYFEYKGALCSKATHSPPLD
jgi:hypothetical protein